MPAAPFDIADCLARVRQRDEQAASDLVRELFPLVRKIVHRHLPRRTSEEDLCQMIFIKLFQNLNQYSGKVAIEHWVSRIAVNTCLNQLQSEKSRPELSWADMTEEQASLVQYVADNVSSGADLDSVVSNEVVEKLLGALNPQDRLVINLIHLEGYSIQEVKQMTGWNTALVKIRAFRARRKLKDTFYKLMSEGKL